MNVPLKVDLLAYRNPYPVSRFRVFEVDHPAPQTWKCVRLREAGIAIPDSLTFAPVDFERQTLPDGLNRAGLKANEPVRDRSKHRFIKTQCTLEVLPVSPRRLSENAKLIF